MSAHAHHHEHDHVEFNELDLDRPQALRLAARPAGPACSRSWPGAWSRPPGSACSGSSGPLFLYVIMPALDTAIGKDSANPPDSVLKRLEEDRYYRWCTYAYMPLQFASLVGACWLWAYGDLSFVESLGLALTVGLRRRHRDQHRARARPQAAEHSSGGCPRSRSRRRATGTSSSSTTAATTCAWPRPRTRPARAWARASGASCRARSGAA